MRTTKQLGNSYSDGFDIGYQVAIRHVRERAGVPLDGVKEDV